MFRIPSEKQQLRDLLKQANEIIETQAAVLEDERQWRLKSLPALLEAEARAKRAEARVAELEAALVVNQPKSCAKVEIPADPRIIPSSWRES